MGSWGEIGGEGSVGEVGIGEGGIGEGGGVGGGGGDDGSGLDACGWLGVRGVTVGSKDLRRMDRGVRFVTGVGVSEGGSCESGDGGDGKTGLGGL